MGARDASSKPADIQARLEGVLRGFEVEANATLPDKVNEGTSSESPDSEEPAEGPLEDTTADAPPIAITP